MTGKCDDCGKMCNLHTLVYGTPAIWIVKWELCSECKRLRFVTIDDVINRLK